MASYNFAKAAKPGFRPMLKGLKNPLDVASLPVLTVDTYMIYDTLLQADGNSNPQIAFHDNQFFALWSSAAAETAAPGQGYYATSADGESWSAKLQCTGAPPEGFRFSPNGLWLREGVLWALYYYTEQTPGVEGPSYYGPSLALRGRPWVDSAWGAEQTILEDALLDCAPVLLRTGLWHGTGRNHLFETQMILGDLGDWTRIIIPSPSGVLLNEATILPVGDGSIISYEYRNEEDMQPRKLLRSFSYDDGVTISPPVWTNFPDGKSRRAVMRLSDGRYILCSNAIDSGNTSIRTKLMLSVSDDGFQYDRVYILRGEATTPKWGGSGLQREGYQYPQFLEKDGYLWVIYSRNKEDIQITRVALNAFV